MKDNIIHTAINEILVEHNIKAFWEELLEKEVDGMIKLEYKGQTQKFFVEIKKEFREYHLPNLFMQQKKYNPFMVLAEKKIFPKIKDALVGKSIAFIDLCGNINIETDNLLLKVEGKGKKYIQQEKYGRAFTKAGLKTLFLFLTNNNSINDTYRDIANNAGIALGTVKLVFEGLLEEGFALPLNDKELKLTNKEQLLQKWITAYNEKLKPALKIGNFRFNNPGDFAEWKKMNLNKTQTLWGGEPAGNIYTKFLHPEILTLYTVENKSDLLKKYRLIPDPQGNVLVYEKFWKVNDTENDVAPPVIVYADLLASGKKRCIETAQKLYEERIKNTL